MLSWINFIAEWAKLQSVETCAVLYTVLQSLCWC